MPTTNDPNLHDPTPPEPPPHDPIAALRHRDYRVFLAAIGCVSAATQLQHTVLSWQVYAITHDPLSLGLVGLAEAIPFLSLTLVGGWAADHVDRRQLALASLAALLACAMLLLWISLGPLASAWPLYACQVLAGLGRAFFRPVSVALGTDCVPREQYQNAASWRASLFHTCTILGPAVAGGLLLLGGPRAAYAVTTALLVAGVAALAALPRRPRPALPPTRLATGLAEGVRFVWADQLLLSAMSLDLFAVLFGGANALLPVFAQEVLHVGELGFGLLRAAPAAGSVVMSLALARFAHLRHAGRALLWSVALFGVTWILFAVSRSFPLSLALLALGGALDNVSMVLRNTLVQVRTPQEKMGRVAAVNSFFIGSSNELGAFESGVAARLMGTVPSVIFGGAMTLVTVGIVAWTAPRLRRLQRLDGREG